MTPLIFVLAGVNGGGKSSVGGRILRRRAMNYFNPDEAAARIREELGCSADVANAYAWDAGKQLLEKAIRERTNHAFEATLGGTTMPRLLGEAADAGFEVRVWFVGLATVEQHIARVQARVARGGHDIPEAKIRERWDASRRNLVVLMPRLTELRVFDNSEERDADTGQIPAPRLLLHWQRGAVVAPPLPALESTPEWAKPIVACALQLSRNATSMDRSET
ncbi:MAG TPA: AAA family ATPase [Thermoanaerobaculia bacterium]|nr:AAA family ATPase [Thermoanaerobaculia bacterium]